MIEEVFRKTSILKRVQDTGSAPFFLNFSGKSPLDIALANHEINTF